MNNLNLRNVVLLLGAVIVALLVLGFISTILGQIVPLAIALVIGVVLGRMSHQVDVRAALMNSVRRQAVAQIRQQAAQPKTSQSTEKPAAAAVPERLVDKPPADDAPITDFEIKTDAELQAEARRLEEEVARKSAEYDPMTALEERRRRLLGDQADDASE
jgi:hypothetical protein